jgi:hypothetical protein
VSRRFGKTEKFHRTVARCLPDGPLAAARSDRKTELGQDPGVKRTGRRDFSHAQVNVVKPSCFHRR